MNVVLALKRVTLHGWQSELKTCQWFVAVMEGIYQLYRIYDTRYDPKWPNGYFRRDVTLCKRK